jgi:hypothetical protein
MWSTGFFLPLLLLLPNTAVAHVVSEREEVKNATLIHLLAEPLSATTQREERLRKEGNLSGKEGSYLACISSRRGKGGRTNHN